MYGDEDWRAEERGPAGKPRPGRVRRAVPHDGFAQVGGVRLLLRKGKRLPEGVAAGDVWPAERDATGALVPVREAHRVKEGLWRPGKAARRPAKKRTTKGGKK